MAKINLEDYLNGLKSALEVKDEEKLKLEFRILDNYSIVFYGQDANRHQAFVVV